MGCSFALGRHAARGVGRHPAERAELPVFGHSTRSAISFSRLTMTTLRPCSVAMRRSSRAILRPILGCALAVGSSARITAGSTARAWRWPPAALPHWRAHRAGIADARLRRSRRAGVGPSVQTRFPTTSRAGYPYTPPRYRDKVILYTPRWYRHKSRILEPNGPGRAGSTHRAPSCGRGTFRIEDTVKILFLLLTPSSRACGAVGMEGLWAWLVEAVRWHTPSCRRSTTRSRARQSAGPTGSAQVGLLSL
jgi:hypothetical protein